MQKTNSPSNTALLYFARLTCAATLFLIFMGGLVKSHEAGLSVPDWPTTYQENMFLFAPSNWVGGIFYEHTHRLVASGIGLLTVILTVWVIYADRRRFVWGLAIAAFLAVFLQGILGGLTVLFYLPAAISVSHAVLAQTFFLLLLALSYYLSYEDPVTVPENKRSAMRSFWKSSLFLTGLVYLQLLIGAIMRHTESGLAIPGFPLFAGHIIPVLNESFMNHVNNWRFDAGLDPVSFSQVLSHLMHRLLGFLILGFVIWQTWRVRKMDYVTETLSRTHYLLCLITCLQVMLGGMSIWTGKAPLITSIHVVFGAALLGTSLLINLRAFPGKTVSGTLEMPTGQKAA